MTNAELLAKIKAEIERRITDNTFGAKLELIDILAWLDTLESEKPINPDDAMKALNEKIALVKQRGTWDGVDVDKYMDEVRGRVSDDLEEAADEYANKHYSEWDESWDDYNGHNVEPENDKLELMDAFIAGAKWMSIHGNDIKEL